MYGLGAALEDGCREPCECVYVCVLCLCVCACVCLCVCVCRWVCVVHNENGHILAYFKISPIV